MPRSPWTRPNGTRAALCGSSNAEFWVLDTDGVAEKKKRAVYFNKDKPLTSVFFFFLVFFYGSQGRLAMNVETEGAQNA